MTHTSSMKFELRCAWSNMPFCVRAHVTQIVALWNRKKNPSQFKLMTWLLFLKWAGVYTKSLHASPEQGEHPSVRLPESRPAGLAKASEGVWQGSSKGGRRLHGLLYSLKTCIPFFLSFYIHFYQISFSYWIFCSSRFWKVCCKTWVLHLFLGHKCFRKSDPKHVLSHRKMSIRLQTGQKFSDAQILRNPGRPPVKIPSKCSQWHWMKKNDRPSKLL